MGWRCFAKAHPARHCEERRDEAIYFFFFSHMFEIALLRFARNDERVTLAMTGEKGSSACASPAREGGAECRRIRDALQKPILHVIARNNVTKQSMGYRLYTVEIASLRSQ